ncbi:ribonuclease H-like domain-containing protein [Tanacetum coccineum]
MFVHGYTDDEYETSVHSENDNVTLISKLDVSHPLHLHPNDSVTLNVVFVKLKGTEKYQVWSCAMLLALEGKNKNGFIDDTCKSNAKRPQTSSTFARPLNMTRPSNSGNRRPNVNVIDISKLRIKVSHPNGTEALITKVGNMKLTEHLTLYDMLIIPECCVSLMSVHKVARDSKLVEYLNTSIERFT